MVICVQVHRVCTYLLLSAGFNQSESVFGLRIHVTSGFNDFQVITVILTRSWWPTRLTFNPKHSNEVYYSTAKFRENRIKTVAVIVPPFFSVKMTAVTSLIMLMSQNINHQTLNLISGYSFIERTILIALIHLNLGLYEKNVQLCSRLTVTLTVIFGQMH